MKRLFIEKGPSNRANKILEVGLWVSYIFGLKQKFWRESVGYRNSIYGGFKKLERNKS